MNCVIRSPCCKRKYFLTDVICPIKLSSFIKSSSSVLEALWYASLMNVEWLQFVAEKCSFDVLVGRTISRPHCRMTFKYFPVRKMMSASFSRKRGMRSSWIVYRLSQYRAVSICESWLLNSLTWSTTKNWLYGSIITPCWEKEKRNNIWEYCNSITFRMKI